MNIVYTYRGRSKPARDALKAKLICKGGTVTVKTEKRYHVKDKDGKLTDIIDSKGDKKDAEEVEYYTLESDVMP